MRHSSLSFLFLGTNALTVLLLQWWQQPSYIILQCSVLACITILFLFRKKQSTQGALAVCLGFSLALFAVARTHHVPSTRTVDTYATEQTVTLEGWISAEPDRRPMQTKYTVSVTTLETASGAIIEPITGDVLATDQSFWPRYAYGDAIRVRGTLEKPGDIDGFRYDHYLSRFGIYAVMYRGSFAALDEPKRGNPLLGFLFALKEKFEAQTNRLYPEPHASFMAGLLTGSRKGIPENVLADFQFTGLTHIIAISGYNISIVIAIIGNALFWLPQRHRFVPSVLAIMAFTLFVGASAAVVRAAIMGILGLLALHTHNLNHARLTVLWTLVLMITWNPKQLWWDAGFQLSFLAVIGLMEVGPYLAKWVRWFPETLGIREAIQMTMAAQITAVPWIIVLFGRFSLIAPLANLLVAPFIPPAMLFGFLGTVLSILWMPLGLVVAYIGWACLEWIIQVAHALARVPYASVDIPNASLIFATVYYVFLACILGTRKRNATV